MMLSWIQRSWRGGLERDLEGIVVVGMGVRASVCAMEAATRLIDNWSDCFQIWVIDQGMFEASLGKLRGVLASLSEFRRSKKDEF